MRKYSPKEAERLGKFPRSDEKRRGWALAMFVLAAYFSPHGLNGPAYWLPASIALLYVAVILLAHMANCMKYERGWWDPVGALLVAGACLSIILFWAGGTDAVPFAVFCSGFAACYLLVVKQERRVFRRNKARVIRERIRAFRRIAK